MLFELLTQPDRFLDSVRRYTMSLTTSITYGFRTVTSDDPRQKELFDVVEALAEIVQSAGGALLEVFPLLRWLPEFLLPTKRVASEQHKREEKLYTDLWLKAKEEIKSGTTRPCFCKDMLDVQEKEGVLGSACSIQCWHYA